MRPHREIVDGQQRMLSIVDYREGKFALGNNSKNYAGKRFEQLSDDEREAFLTYTVSVDVIRNAQRPDILQMFRRMNAYTLPLNDAEKRHSEFHGVFKDWINRLVDAWGPVLSEWKVLSSRSIVRMEDAEFFAEIALSFKLGIKSSSNTMLRNLYVENDDVFAEAEEWAGRINEIFSLIQAEFSPIQNSYMTKSYAFQSLVIALAHNMWGIPGLEGATGVPATGKFCTAPDTAIEKLLELASAHETKDTDGKYRDYVEACKGGSNRLKQRLARVYNISLALQGKI